MQPLKIPRIDINDYPAVKAHLDTYWDKIKNRADQGDTPYNLRNCAYIDDFNQPKIVYPETTQGAYFVYDEKGYFLDKTCFMLIAKTDVMKYLCATLSSHLFEFAYKTIFSSVAIGASGYQYNKHALIKLPILKQKNTMRDDYTDDYFYHLYGLTDEEIAYIEKS